MKSFRSLILEGYGEALPLWLKAICKAFPELKFEEVDQDQFIVEWKHKPIVGVSFEDNKIQMELIKSGSKPKEFEKMSKKGFKKEEHVRDFIYKALDVFKLSKKNLNEAKENSKQDPLVFEWEDAKAKVMMAQVDLNMAAEMHNFKASDVTRAKDFYKGKLIKMKSNHSSLKGYVWIQISDHSEYKT